VKTHRKCYEFHKCHRQVTRQTTNEYREQVKSQMASKNFHLNFHLRKSGHTIVYMECHLFNTRAR